MEGLHGYNGRWTEAETLLLWFVHLGATRGAECPR